MHSGEKPNKCNQCDYATYHASHLARHLKKHSGEKPHKCNQCDFASSQTGDLRKHLKRHSGEKQKLLHPPGVLRIHLRKTQTNLYNPLAHFLRIHLKTCTNKSNLCDNVFSPACNLRRPKSDQTLSLNCESVFNANIYIAKCPNIGAAKVPKSRQSNQNI